jgi:hypothetical protein
MALIVVGLASTGCSFSRPTRTGYLSDYAQLAPDRFHINPGIGPQRAETRHASPGDLDQIDSFYLEPTQWLIDSETRAGKSPERREALVARLQQELRDQLGAIRPIVPSPGPRTATIRTAITRVRLGRPIANLALTATFFTPIPIGPIFSGGASLEAEAVAPDGRQLAAVSSVSSGGVIDLVGLYSKSRHASQAMKRNVKEFKEALIQPPSAPTKAPSGRLDP